MSKRQQTRNSQTLHKALKGKTTWFKKSFPVSKICHIVIGVFSYTTEGRVSTWSFSTGLPLGCGYCCLSDRRRLECRRYVKQYEDRSRYANVFSFQVKTIDIAHGNTEHGVSVSLRLFICNNVVCKAIYIYPSLSGTQFPNFQSIRMDSMIQGKENNAELWLSTGRHFTAFTWHLTPKLNGT